MKKLKLFFACLLMAVLSIGQVWATLPTSPKWEAKTLADIADGSTVIIISNSTTATNIALPAAGAGTSNPPKKACTVSTTDGVSTITPPTGTTLQDLAWTLKKKTSTWQFFVEGSTTNCLYLTGTSSNTALRVGEGTSNNEFVMGDLGKLLKVTTAARFVGPYDNNGSDWRTYNTENATNYKGAQLTFYVLKAAACTSEVEVTKGAETNGTYTLSDTKVCGDGDGGEITISDIEPADGYAFDKITATEGTVDNENKKVTGITDNTTITVLFKALPKYTVSFNTGAGNPAVSPIPEATAGAGITLPAGPTPACSADGWTFAGWAAAAVATEATTAPALLTAGTNYKPTENCTLFAVYKRTEGGSGAAVNTVMWSEDWSGASSTDRVPSAPTSTANVYGSATISYSWNNGDSNTQLYEDQNGPHADANNWNVLVGKKNGNLTISGIPTGKASTLSLSYAVAGSGTIGVSTTTENVSISDGTITIEDANVTAFDLVFTNTHSTKNIRLDDIVVSVATTTAAGTTYYLSAPSCCTKHTISIATGILYGSVEADLSEACEGTIVTLTFTPATNYHLSGWTLNDEAQDVNANTFSMPAGAATVSATFAQDACDPLATPVVAVSGKAYPYNAVKLAWTAIEHADAYKVYIYDNEDNELEHNDAFAGVEYTIGQALSASTTYKYSVQAISNTPATYCPSTEAASTFTTDALPTAHLRLIALGEDHASSGDYAILTPFNLPATAATCSKAFVGWDANSECATDPTYAAGAEFTFQNTDAVTLYAVYADETPGEATLTKLGSNYAPTAGDKLVIVGVDGDDQYALYRETQSSSYVKNWAFDNNVATVAADAKKYVTLEAATDGKFYLGDATNGYVYSSSSNNLSVDASNKTEWTIAWDNEASAFTFNQGKYLSCRSDLSGANQYLYRLAGGTPAGIYKLDVYKYAAGASTFDNYSTTCVAAPTAEPASASIAVAAAGGEGTLGVSYENVNLAGVEVALFNNEACTEAFDGGWLSASTAGDDKHIAYNAQANTSYNDARTAYIKLTAPETNGAANPAVVVIPVEQAKKPAVFDNLADLVAANIATGTQVTVSFEEVITNDQTISGPKRAGLFLTTTAGSNSKAIEIFYNKGTTAVPAEWVIGGKLAATSMTFTWTLFNSDQWELVPLGNDWTWDNGDLTYTAPKAVSSVVVSGAPSKTSYVDGEKFAPAGLKVTVNYNDDTHEENPVGVTFECTPERVAKSDEPVSVSVVATFNEVSSEAFPVNVTVGDIQLKTVTQFIEAGNADMRCYLEGIVSDIETGTKLKYGNFNLTDGSGTIYVYGCLNQDGEAQKFDELDVQNGDKIKVIAEDYDYYNKHEAKNVQFVSKKSPATMTFNDLALEFGEEETMVPASITLADASDIVYSIKEGSDDCVTISDDQITAKSVAGTATIVATLAETDDYVGATAEFAVTVSAPITKYAITFDENGADGGDAPAAIANQAEGADVPLPANTWTKTNHKFTGWKVINNTTSAEVDINAGAFEMPASAVTIQAQWAEIPSWAYVYDNNVVVAHTGSGTDDGTITISETEYKLVKAGAGSNTGTIKVTVPAGATDLHFHAFAWGGKTAKIQIAGVENASISEFDLSGEAGAAGSGNDFTLKGVPVDQYYHVSFDAVAAETEIVFSKATGSADNRFFFYGVNQVGGDFGSYQRTVTENNYGTICLPYAGTISGATLYEIASFENEMIYVDEILSGKLEAGVPYIFQATSTQLNVAYTANIYEDAGSANGLYGFYDLTNENAKYDIPGNAGNYILYQDQYWFVDNVRAAYIANYRAYIKLNQINNKGAQAPGRRRVAMPVNGANAPQGVDNIESGNQPMKKMINGTLYIIRGEKQYDATGRLVK